MTDSEKNSASKELIVYWSKTSHTKQAAEDIAMGLRAERVKVDVISLDDAVSLSEYEVVVVGSPCYGGSFGRLSSGLAPVVKSFLEAFEAGSLDGKKAAAFSVFAGFGGGRTLDAIEKHLRRAGVGIIERGVAVKAGLPLSIGKGPDASESDREKLQELGQRIGRQITS